MTNHELAELERKRLRLLVAADVDAVGDLHADDFQLITPGGNALTKREYMDAVGSGEVNYLSWEADGVDARVHAGAGCVRYWSTIHIVVEGEEISPARYWHTDYYENRDGRWQVLWSQATQAAS